MVAHTDSTVNVENPPDIRRQKDGPLDDVRQKHQRWPPSRSMPERANMAAATKRARQIQDGCSHDARQVVQRWPLPRGTPEKSNMTAFTAIVDNNMYLIVNIIIRHLW